MEKMKNVVLGAALGAAAATGVEEFRHHDQAILAEYVSEHRDEFQTGFSALDGYIDTLEKLVAEEKDSTKKNTLTIQLEAAKKAQSTIGVMADIGKDGTSHHLKEQGKSLKDFDKE